MVRSIWWLVRCPGFIPFEEHPLLEARGEDDRASVQATPYRAFRGVR